MNIKNNFFKIMLFSLTIMLCLLVVFTNVSMAASSITSQIKPDESASTPFTGAMEVIVGLAQIVAVGMAAIMIIVLAVKYMSSSSNERAEIKKHAVVYIVGACIAFGAAGLLQILKTFTTETLK